MAGQVAQTQALSILYDLALTISGEVTPDSLLTKLLQRLLYHTGFTVGLFLSGIRQDADDSVTATVEAAVGDYDLLRHKGERLRLPAALLEKTAHTGSDRALLETLPLREAQEIYLRLPVEDEGIILLLTKQHAESPIPLTALLEPVIHRLAHNYRLCHQVEGSFKEIVEQYSGVQLVQALYDDIFANTRDGILITDSEQRIIDANAAFSRVTGYTKEEILGQTPRLLRSGRHDAAFYARMWESIARKGYWRGEIWNRRKSGGEYLEIINIGVVRDAAGRISHYFAIFTDISELKEIQQQLARASHYDALTGLPNRTLFGERLEEAIDRARRSGDWLAVACLDVDHFKTINDAYGKTFGDKMVSAIAQRLSSVLKPGETLARLAGVEFGLLMTEQVSLDAAAARVNELQAYVATSFEVERKNIEITASAGVTLYPSDLSNADTLLRHAQIALHQAKEISQGTAQFFDADQDRLMRERRELIQRVRKAIHDDELQLYYQPKVSLENGEVTGFEALLRWIDPERGLVPPGDFLPSIETHPLIIEIGEWVIRTALQQLSDWRKDGLVTSVSVNIASLHLQQPDFAEQLRAALARTPDVPGSAVEIEILESVAMEDTDHVRRVIQACREFGVLFALDDFGTGYSSLSYLKNLPADILKVDQSFVRDMLVDKSDRAVVAGAISLARAFERSVVAEGVESAEHVRQVRQLGCDIAQGYGIARPMPAAEVSGWVAQFSWPFSGRG